MQKKDIAAWLIVLIGSALSVSVLFLFYFLVTGEWLPQILPQVQEDSIHYLVQVKEVLDGKPFLGNPYILEYSNVFYNGLLLPIWMAALPGLLGADINSVFAINALLYAMLTGAIMYILCMCTTNRNRILSVITAIVGMASLHNMMIRPAIMQTVYPVMGLFMIALLGVLTFPRKKSTYVSLGAITVFAFYLYTHLWISTFTSIGLLVLWSLFKKDKSSLKLLLLMCLGIAIAGLPQIWNIFSLFFVDSAHQLNMRVGLVQTHTVLPLTLMNMKYTILIAGSLVILSFRQKFSATEKMILLVSLGLVIASVSNVITGYEMDFYSHYWQLSLMIYVVAIAAFIPIIAKRKDVIAKIILGFCTFALLFTTVNRTFVRANAYRYLRFPEKEHVLARSIQEYKQVIDYFNDEGITNQVILSHSHLGQYITLYTKNYVFSISRAWIHIIPTPELLTRFIAFYVDKIDEDFLIENIQDYSGMNPEHTAWYANAYKYKMEAIDVLGGEKFIQAALAEHKQINQSYDETLKRFNVSYAIIDNERDDNPRLPAEKTIVMKNERFTIYEL
ncbi:hypothetical protein KKF55_02575 [Patescibacteria group bacterium]|nr:hypothetical protein [Patescibacteria group bacterium]